MKFKFYLLRMIFLTTIILFALVGTAEAEKGVLKNARADGTVYYLKTTSCEIYTGKIVEFIHSPEDGDGIRFETELGTAKIFESQIDELIEESKSYRQSHRVFIMPTAQPIADNHFIGNFELLFFYAGLGIGDWVSITAGRSVLPTVRSSEQINEFNAKVSFPVIEFDSATEKVRFAAGVNYATINDNNKLLHAYAAADLELSQTRFTALGYANLSKDPIFAMQFGDNSIATKIQTGGFGIGLGLETKLSSQRDIRVIGEIWNYDVTCAVKTLSLLGVRFSGRVVSADFGIAYSTAPFVAPFVSFVWTPF